LEKKAFLKSLGDQKEKLLIKAPFDGQIVGSENYLHKGRWLSKDLQLFKVVDPESYIVSGYFREEDMGLFDVGARGRFYPRSSLTSPVDVIVTAINRTNVTNLEDQSLASVYGGPIAVEEAKDFDYLKPHESIYRVTMEVKSSSREEVGRFALNGYVRLQAARKSYFRRMFDSSAALVVRELNL
jgi:putative peptide zinc metalloprotease protein